MRPATRFGRRPVGIRGTILPPISSALPGVRARSASVARPGVVDVPTLIPQSPVLEGFDPEFYGDDSGTARSGARPRPLAGLQSDNHAPDAGFGGVRGVGFRRWKTNMVFNRR